MQGALTQPAVVQVAPDIGRISVRLVTDPPGKTATPALRKLCVAVHIGRPVYMFCRRGGEKHSGLLVHGDIDIIPAHMPTVWEPRQQDTALALGIEPTLLTSIAEECGFDGGRLQMLNRFQIRDPQIENIAWALKAEMEAGYPGGRVFSDSLATALATCLVRRHSSLAPMPSARNGGVSGRQFKQVLSYIEDTLAEDISLSDIAAVAGVSRSHLKVIFRRAMGVPVHQYVIQRRVERARELLSGSALSISEIAAETGFTHQSHLAYHMRRILGASPKELRALNP
jgi:AraC family transcriptional regulator